jgi:hypothetical protein
MKYEFKFFTKSLKKMISHEEELVEVGHGASQLDSQHLGKLRQEDLEFKASLVHIGSQQK